jgi:hypothetical protein
MRAVLIALGVLGLTSSHGSAQPAQATNSTPVVQVETESPVLRSSIDFSPTLSSSETLRVGKNVQLSGPLIVPLKAKRTRDVPRKILQMLNPFSKPSEEAQAAQEAPVRSRAWSTTGGWSPGPSAFADETRHEPQLKLISGSTGK